MKKILLAITFSGLTALTHSALALTIEDKAAFNNYLSAMAENEISGFVNSNDSVLGGEVKGYSASKIISAYHNNEVAADKEFKGKPVRIKTVAYAIKKDFSGDAFIVATGKNASETLHLKVNGDDERIQKINRGEKIDFVCIGKGMVIGTPILESCVYPKDFGESVFSSMSQSLSKVEGKSYKPRSQLEISLLAAYLAIEKEIKEGCSKDKKSCSSIAMEHIKNMKMPGSMTEGNQVEIKKLLDSSKSLPIITYTPMEKTRLLKLLE